MVTVTKSKFYLLKINYPKLFEEVNTDKHDTVKFELPEKQHDPLADAAESPQDQLGINKLKIQTLKDDGIKAYDLNEDETEENKEKRSKILKKDRERLKQIQKETEDIVKGLEAFKVLEESQIGSTYNDRFKNVKYIEREEDLELKKMYEDEQERFNKLAEELKDKIEGEIDMDMHGNVQFRSYKQNAGNEEKQEEVKTGIQGTGTYILRDGQLVPGQGETREQAQYSNWYCSNADPEDIRRHRELMDRMHYRGPKWEGQGVPKSILEEFDPTYLKREGEEHPSSAKQDQKEGKKEFEYVVR
ncbi:UNKNOWN [Stylonychia lemnae]|uniref:Uncharacterized protein n=1 Tax=Stylonychia lemnae TaxID=5949 RepID=A0A078ACC4_STYLE|nr:UNKNOWN [Stylonychia lemnae]|eukprot:CDW79905.1 UNKNOWN [Stylonychia lemnae]